MKLRNKIIYESLKVLIFASILSSIGGFALKSVEEKLIFILPIFIILPALNDMIGDFGIIIVNKFTTHLYLRKNKRPHKEMHFVKHFLVTIVPIAIMSAIYISIIALIISNLKGFITTPQVIIKIISITLLATIFLISIIFILSIFGSLYVFKKNKDPDDLLIPITTSVADMGTMILLALFIKILF